MVTETGASSGNEKSNRLAINIAARETGLWSVQPFLHLLLLPACSGPLSEIADENEPFCGRDYDPEDATGRRKAQQLLLAGR